MSFSGAVAQHLKLSIEAEQESEQKVLDQLSFNKDQLSLTTVQYELDSIFSKLETLGYLDAKLDTLVHTDTLYTAHSKMGKKMTRIKIYYDHIPSFLLNKKDLNPISRETTPSYFEIPFSQIQTAMQYLAYLFEKKGN